MNINVGFNCKVSELTNGRMVIVAVHYRPVQIINAKLGINIEIPALTRDDIQNFRYNSVVIPDVVQEVPRVAQAGFESIIIPAKDLAPSLIRDSINSIYGASVANDAIPGVACFEWVPDFKPSKENIIDLVKKTKRFAQSLVRIADDLANNDRARDISDQHVDAAKFLGVNALWIPRGESEGIGTNCPFCTRPISSAAIKCPHCNEVVNAEAYAELKAKQEKVAAAVVAGKGKGQGQQAQGQQAQS